MAISDLLNRRVRARPEDDEVFSEASGSEDGSQDGSDAESNGSIQSVSQPYIYSRIPANKQTSQRMTPKPKNQAQAPNPKATQISKKSLNPSTTQATTSNPH